MLDVWDFIKERGGDPEKVRESQRRRNAPVAAVDEVIALYEDHRKSMNLAHPFLYLRGNRIHRSLAKYEASQVGTRINANQKEIGAKKKVSVYNVLQCMWWTHF